MKKLLTTIILGLFIAGYATGQTNVSEKSMHDSIQKETNEIYDSLVEIRRDIHRHPEISEQEKRTSAKIESYLTSLGLEVKTGIGGYGVIGILKGDKDGKHIAWRADMDAVPSDFPDVVEFASQNKGIRHICGHDVHTTIGLGIAHILSKHKNEINGTIYFIFQPAEEIMNKGAESMIADGLFEIIDPTEIYALHMTPLPVGFITAKEKELYSYFRTLTITYKDISNQDAVVEYTRDLIKSYNTVDAQFWDGRNIGHPQIGIGSPETIYKKYLAVAEHFNINTENNLLDITVRISATNKADVDSLPIKLEKNIAKSEFADHVLSVHYDKQHPTVYNHPTLTKAGLTSIASIYGEKAVAPTFGVINGFNDDFAYFQQKVPGVYFLLGGSDFQKGIISMPHSPNFAVDDKAIKIGVTYFSSMLVERLRDE